MASEVEISVKTVDRGSAALKGVSNQVKGLNDGIEGAQRSWAKYTLAIGAAGVALGGIAVAGKAAMSALTEGAQLQLAQSRFDNLAASIGTTADALTGELGAATQGMLSNAQIVASATDIISLGLGDTSDEVVRLGNLVGQLGWDMQVLTLTLANDSKMRLDSLGLSVSDIDARVEALTASGMALGDAFDLAVIEAGEAKLALVGSAADTSAGKIQHLGAMWADATAAFKINFADAVVDQLDSVTDAIGKNAPGFEAGMGELGKKAGSAMGAAMSVAASVGLDSLNHQIAEKVGISQRELTTLYNQIADREGMGIWLNAEEDLRLAQLVNEQLITENSRVLSLIDSHLALAEALREADGQGQDSAETNQKLADAMSAQAVAARKNSDHIAGLMDSYKSADGAATTFYGSFAYGQMVIDQQAAAVDNLAARHKAYQEQMATYQAAMAAGGDSFMAQAGADAGDQIFSADMAANTDAISQAILGMADDAGAGALAMADLNIKLGEMEPAAARAAVAAVVAQSAIQQLVGAWQAGEIDTTQLVSSVDAVIAELQNKDLPTIELEIQAKKVTNDQPWHNLPLEERQIDIEANYSPVETALGTALGLITGSPSDQRTLKILADYEAVTTAAESDIPNAISGISDEARTVQFLSDTKLVDDDVTRLDNSHIQIIVDYTTGTPPPIPGNAVGGPVSRSNPYIVGEAGPELFIPWTDGSIVPNHRVNWGGGDGGGLTIYNYFYGPTNAADVARATDTAGRRLIERLAQGGMAT